jgi:hypothetical protein
MQIWRSLLELVFSRERRNAKRLPDPRLAAFYWNGAAPMEHGIRDISSTGFFLITEERWYPGTLVMMTLQKKGEAEDSPNRSISVRSKAVRWGSDGVGLKFVLPDEKESRRGPKPLEGGADRKALEGFLKSFKTGEGSVMAGNVTPPDNSSSVLRETKL